MRSFVSDYFGWLIAFVYVWLFFLIIFSVSRVWIEFITWWELCFHCLRSLMRISLFSIKKWSISCAAIERLIVWIKLIILYERLLFCSFFRPKIIFILRRSIKRNQFTLILDPRHYLFSHLRFVPWIILSIFRINIIIRNHIESKGILKNHKESFRFLWESYGIQRDLVGMIRNSKES